MKKITLFLIMLGFFLTASAQYSFDPIVGPTNVASGTPVTINLNDLANAVAVPASSTGSYNSFSISVDWTVGAGNPWSTEADVTVTTTAGSITIDPPTTGGLTNNDDTTLTFEGDLPAIYNPTTDGYIDLVFNQSFGGSDADWSNIIVTLFESPTCVEPFGITSSSVTSASAILDWTAGDSETDWNIEYNSGADFTPGNGEEESSIPVSGTPTTTLTGLTPATTYYLYYQANCGTGDFSLWVGPFTFETLCDVYIPDYIENFATVTFAEAPDCWDEADNGDLTTGPQDLGASAWTSDGFLNDGTTGAYKINLFGGANVNDWIISPLFDLTGGPFQVEFDFAITEWNSSDSTEALDDDDTVQLLMTTDSGTTWIELLLYDTNSVVPIPGIHPIVNLTAYSGQTVQFAIYASEGTDGTSGADVDVFVDNFQVRNIPTCPEPQDLAITNITSNGAEFSWTEGGTSTDWNVEIVPTGTTPTGTPTVTSVSNPYIATGLDAITAYDFYVQAICGPGDNSSWTGPLIFSTLCDVFIPDYIQNFTSVTFAEAPDCWDEADNGDLTTGPQDLGASAWTSDGFLNDGTTGAYKINLFGGANVNDWIISPLFDLTGGPFQVEFDFAITEWNSSNSTEALDDDDTVQLLMTTDSGTTWIELLLYDTNSVVPIPGIHPVVDLTAYAGQIVQFAIYASEGTDGTSGADVDVFVDNFRVRGIPTCPEPSDLTANNLSLTSTELGWTETGVSTSWNIQYGEAGFALGTGTIEAGITTNPYVLTGLTPDTAYEFYVSAICGPGDESSYFGPFSFFTGYCESLPTSNDGDGVNNVTIGITDFPSFGDEFYENHTTPVVNAFQGINTNVEIEFGHGTTYFTSIWIDFNDNLVFDTDELVYEGESPGGSNPHLLDASFVMPLTATIGEHRMRIVTHDFAQTPLNPCYSGSWGVTLDFTVNIQELLCTLAEADYTTVPDCENDQFFIDVNITSLGDATSLEISNNFDASTIQALTVDTYQVGPFAFGTAVKVFVTNEQDNNCVISSETFEVLACPPSNDDCGDAIVAVVNDGATCEDVTPGTILAATPSGVDPGTCGGTPNDDVWFSFTALSEIQIISINNIVGGTANIDHAVYEGDCGALTELYCSDAVSSVTTALDIGNTYYIRIFSGGPVSETSTFDLCIREAPSNLICENAENFCSVGGALTTANIVGIPSTGQVACLGSIPNPTWNIIQVGETGPIEIEINQQDDSGNGLDVDFVIWGPFDSVDQGCIEIILEDCPTCPFSNVPDNGFYPFGNIVDCSYSGSATENLSIDDATAGEIYMLLVTNFNGGAGNITIEQTNIGGTDNGTIEAEITAEIVSDDAPIDQDNDPTEIDEVSVCGFDSITLIASSPFADEYVWFKDGFEIAGETGPTLVVTESDNYYVNAYDSQCGDDADSQFVIVNMYNYPDPVTPQNITVCDGPEADGMESFDLDALTTDLGLDGFTVSYYTNTTDANQAMNAVASTFDSSGETLIIRIEDADAATNNYLSCRQLSTVELIVNPRPAVNQPDPFVVCDDLDGTVDGITEFNLTTIDNEVSTEADVVITYHASEADAQANPAIGALTSPYSSSGETIYVRAENTTTGCYETTSFDLVVNIVPLAEFDPSVVEYQVCPNASVPISIDIVPSNFSATDVSVSWTLDGNPFSGNSLSLNTVLIAGTYEATITFNDSGCMNTVETTVIELESCVFPEGISPGVSPGQNDTFDLRSFDVTKLEIFNRNGTLVYSKNNYTNEWAGQTNDGDELPVGTYFYTVIYEGGAKSKSAWVYINR